VRVAFREILPIKRLVPDPESKTVFSKAANVFSAVDARKRLRLACTSSGELFPLVL
jgi:hypothetical protein